MMRSSSSDCVAVTGTESDRSRHGGCIPQAVHMPSPTPVPGAGPEPYVLSPLLPSSTTAAASAAARPELQPAPNSIDPGLALTPALSPTALNLRKRKSYGSKDNGACGNKRKRDSDGSQVAEEPDRQLSWAEIKKRYIIKAQEDMEREAAAAAASDADDDDDDDETSCSSISDSKTSVSSTTPADEYKDPAPGLL